MLAVKVLEKKSVIQFFGCCLTLAPLFNIAIAIWIRQTQSPDSIWSWNSVTSALSTGTPSQYVLSFASIMIGVLMLRGSTHAWKYVLFLLGCHILLQLGNLGPNIRKSWLWGLFFLVNVSVFIFIADQLVFKLKIPQGSQKPQPPPPQPESQIMSSLFQVENNEQAVAQVLESKTNFTSPAIAAVSTQTNSVFDTRQKLMIHFEGIGPWAQLMSVSNKRLHVRCTHMPPFEMNDRAIEINFKNGLILQTRLTQQSNQDYYFEYTPLEKADQDLLSNWLQVRLAA